MNNPTIFTSFSILTVVGAVVAVMLATVWHELGHLLVARLLRIPVKLVALGLGPALWRRTFFADIRFEVRAVPLGMAIGVVGRRTSDGHARRPASHDLAVAAGGPMASLLLAPLLFGVALIFRQAPNLSLWLAATGLLSAFLGVLNLIPVPGLDGGHITMLTLALCGWQLSPQREVMVHRMGMRVMLIGCVLVIVLQTLGVLQPIGKI